MKHSRHYKDSRTCEQQGFPKSEWCTHCLETMIASTFQTMRNGTADAEDREHAMDTLIDAKLLAECGCCSHYHPVRQSDFAPDDRFNGGAGECRSNQNRFPQW